MNKILLTFLTIFLLGLGFNKTSVFTDTRDGKSYKTLKVGDLNIMLENLNFAAEGSTCFRDSEEFCKTYGRAYDYKTAMAGFDYDGAQGICPEGWWIPSAEQWIYLIQNSGGQLKYKKGSKASTLLAKNIFNLKFAGNVSHSNHKYYLIGKKGYYMTSSTAEGNWVVVDFSKSGTGYDLSMNSDALKERAISCRCVQYAE